MGVACDDSGLFSCKTALIIKPTYYKTKWV